jgi:hypothetical protein
LAKSLLYHHRLIAKTDAAPFAAMTEKHDQQRLVVFLGICGFILQSKIERVLERLYQNQIRIFQ